MIELDRVITIMFAVSEIDEVLVCIAPMPWLGSMP